MSTPVPQPPGWPLAGNITTIDPHDPSASFKTLNLQYGEIFKLSIFGSDRYIICSQRLMNELCDESRFDKGIAPALAEVRNGVGSGLFTAYPGEEPWAIAHRVLVPAFGPIGIQEMWDEMYDIATQMVAKWSRNEPDTPITVADDFTKLALDSIALCAMDKRFNSFYHEEMHPFVEAMTSFLRESGFRAQRTRIQQYLARAATLEYEKNIEVMRSVAQEVIDRRRKNPTEKKDLLNAMLFGKDPKTGERMTDASIMDNMITFLIAGHETTSALLSFTTYYLLKTPSTLQKLTEEVDKVVGKGVVKLEHISQLHYLEACLRESLRLSSPAPAFSITPKKGTKDPVVIGGEYTVPHDALFVCWLDRVHRDAAVYGDDAEEFNPDRMLGDNFKNLPSGAWKPFGNGARGCIGRPFAWQEAILALTLVIQNFNLRQADPSYQLQMKRNLTIKPDGFQIKVSLRPGINELDFQKRLFGDISASKFDRAATAALSVDKSKLKPMTILYGGNSGTCEGLSQKLATSAAGHGFNATVTSLDAAVEKLPKDQPIIMISASYEGLPPDNAVHFVEWLKSVKADQLTDRNYAVFGCGHRDWVTTYQKIPTLLDDLFKSNGATQILSRGETNIAAAKIFDDFDAWADKLWPALGSTAGEVTEELDMEVSTDSRATHLRYSLQHGLILKNEVLTSGNSSSEKRYIEVKLPSNTTYEAGDYLAILPMNQLEVVNRVLKRFQLPWDAVLKLKKGSHSAIPTGVDLSVSVVLASYVELNTPATKKNMQTIASFADDSKVDLGGTLQSSVLDILEAHPKIPLPFSVYLAMLAPMRIRQYSISSSPLADPTVASITFSLASDGEPAVSRHPGVATHHLRGLHPGNTAQVAIRRSPAAFHPPIDPKTPVIMLCAGTGIAPFRGFIQDRALKMAASANKEEFAPALLFVGCRDPKVDKLHAKELEAWEAQGAVKVYYAYSRASEQSEGCKYVQDRLWHERIEAVKLFDSDGKVFICGSSAVGKGIAQVVAKMRVIGEKKHGRDMTEEEALAWWEGLKGQRYAVDVFA